MNLLKKILLLATPILHNLAVSGQNFNAADSITDAIYRNDTVFLSRLLDKFPVNSTFGKDQQSLLAYSVVYNKPDITTFLLKHKANPDILFHDYAALHLAARYGRIKIAELLLSSGANPNVKDSLGNTPLFVAAGQKKIKMVKLLVNHGAWVRYQNQYHLTPIMMATTSGNPHIAAYLKNYYELNLPSWIDGPYVNWLSSRRIRITYLRHDSVTQTTHKQTKTISVDSIPYRFLGLGKDTMIYTLQREYLPEKSTYSSVSKLLVLGDIHGDFNNFSSFLLKQHVIDEELNWAWKNGHLIILGDIFDRGEQVTECLWLLNKIQRQAMMAGGQVHIILGNHEVMELNGDYRYLNEKYVFLNDRLHKDYAASYNHKSELGRWIRSFNTMEIIDSILFVHAGIHPYLQEINLGVDQLNTIVRDVLNQKRETNLAPVHHWIMGDSGPLWYRGYFRKFHVEEALPEEQVQKILDFYKVKKIMIGHTNVPGITSLYGGKVLAMDIPYYQGEGKPTGLIIENNKWRLALSDGKLEPFYH